MNSAPLQQPTHGTVEDLKLALESGALIPYLQPQYRLSDGQLKGFELLSHWRLKQDNQVLAARNFLAHLKAPATHWPVFSYLFDQALAMLARPQWRSREPWFTLAINTPADLLARPDFTHHLSQRCQDTGVEPNRLVLEIIDLPPAGDPALMLGMTRARRAGFEVAMDGLEIETADLDGLLVQPFTEIKIGGFALHRAMQCSRVRQRLSVLTRRCAAAGVASVVGELESPEMLQLAASTGFDAGQGFLLGVPADPDRALRTPMNIAHGDERSLDWTIISDSTPDGSACREPGDFLGRVFAGQDTPLSPASRVDPSRDASSSRRGHCLIVEDHASLREEIAQTLIRSGQTCCTAGSLSEARRHLTGGARVDVLILDLALPDGHGLELWHAEHRPGQLQRPETIIFSAHLTAPVEDRARGLGIRHFVQKPASSKAILLRYQQALAQAGAHPSSC